MKSSLVWEKARTVLFMTTLTFVAITGVGVVDVLTQETVMRNRTLFRRQAVADAVGMDRFPSTEALIAWYGRHVEEVRGDDDIVDFLQVRDNDDSRNLVLIQKGPGLWGGITAFVGFNPDNSIRGVTFQDHVETPGLGARIDEPWFRHQFSGKSGPFTALRPEPRDKEALTADDDKFDQITGATVTSTAVKDIMNKTIERARQIASTR